MILPLVYSILNKVEVVPQTIFTYSFDNPNRNLVLTYTYYEVTTELLISYECLEGWFKESEKYYAGFSYQQNALEINIRRIIFEFLKKSNKLVFDAYTKYDGNNISLRDPAIDYSKPIRLVTDSFI